MWAVFLFMAQVIDYRFGVGLLLGFLLTFRYVVIGIYHPIILEMEVGRDARGALARAKGVTA